MKIKIKLKEAFHIFNYLTARKLRGVFLTQIFYYLSLIPSSLERNLFSVRNGIGIQEKKYEKVMCGEIFFIGVAARSGEMQKATERRDVSRLYRIFFVPSSPRKNPCESVG
jgi:hypothetical protein